MTAHRNTQVYRLIRFSRLVPAVAILLCAYGASVPMASALTPECRRDFDHHHELVSTLNSLQKDCASDSPQSINFLLLQEENLSIVKRLEASCNPVGGNSVEQLQKWIDDYEKNKKSCEKVKLLQGAIKEIEEAEKAAEQFADVAARQALKHKNYAEYAKVMLANLDAIEKSLAENSPQGYLRAAGLWKRHVKLQEGIAKDDFLGRMSIIPPAQIQQYVKENEAKAATLQEQQVEKRLKASSAGKSSTQNAKICAELKTQKLRLGGRTDIQASWLTSIDDEMKRRECK